MGVMDPRGRLRYPIHVVYQRLDLAPFAQVGVHIVVVHGASAVDIDQPGILEDAQVMGYGRAGKMGAPGDFRHAHAHGFVLQQSDKDLLAGLIAQRSEGALQCLKFLRQRLPLCSALVHSCPPF